MYVIIGKDGQPLQDIDGKLILCVTAEDAARFAMPGERVEWASAASYGTPQGHRR
jgi:hypothetical protein